MSGVTKTIVLVAFTVLIPGCGGTNLDRAKSSINQTAVEVERLAASIEAGDKPAIRKSLDQLNSLDSQRQVIELNDEEKTIMVGYTEEKLKPAKDRLRKALDTARTTGKLTMAELREFGKEIFQ